MNWLKKRLIPFNIYFFVSALLIPVFVTLYFYSNNTREIYPEYILALLGMEVIIAAGVYIAAHIVFSNSCSALGVSIAWWWFFYSFESINTTLSNMIGPMEQASLVYLPILVLIGIAVGFLFRLLTRWEAELKPILLIFSVILTLFNTVQSIVAVINNNDNTTYAFRTEFSVDQRNTDTPNIYWLHADGMLSFDSVAKYYGDKQDEFYQALISRGFMVNKSAAFEALHKTATSLEVMLDPTLYDENLRPQLQASGTFQAPPNTRKNFELFSALRQKDYSIKLLSTYPEVLYPESADMFIFQFEGTGLLTSAVPTQWQNGSASPAENTAKIKLSQFKVFMRFFAMPLFKVFNRFLDVSTLPYDLSDSDLAQLGMSPTTLEEEQSFAKGFYIALQTDLSPQFSLMMLDTTHSPFNYFEDGTVDHTDSGNLSRYLGNHRYAVKILLGIIDTIRSADPDAVIILQADHGIHAYEESDFKSAFGDAAVATELWNSTLSAICVPDQYKTGEENQTMLTPLNMSRYLVNRFVGQGNYPYLSSSDY